MLVFNEDIEEEGNKFQVTKNTKYFIVGFFGFYPHSKIEDIDGFLDEINVSKVSQGITAEEINFSKNNTALKAYDCFDRRTSDMTILLPQLFSSEEDALYWFKSKVKDSDYICKSDISSINVLDYDEIIDYIKNRIIYEDKFKKINQEFKERLKSLKIQLVNDLLIEFNDEESIGIIKNIQM